MPRQIHSVTAVVLLAAYSTAFNTRVPLAVRITRPQYAVDPRRQEDNRPLAEKMFGSLFSFGKPKEEAEKIVVEAGPLDAGKAISDIDKRAASGELNYQDFIALSRTFAELEGNVPGMPNQLSVAEVTETKQKFAKHEKIVQCMTPEELADPKLMSEDLSNAEEKCPRVQRLSVESGIPEKDVALFVAEFEAMRQSTMRIAAGEDPDEVNRSMGEGKGNRAGRRATKKAQRKAGTSW
mmetsp:Transcript_66628/g.130655  ORF Transcript_66628/g.130655 Transcript_66628/m.130655 type:complete len:237 (-) Transcript_66628:236-946(-)